MKSFTDEFITDFIWGKLLIDKYYQNMNSTHKFGTPSSDIYCYFSIEYSEARIVHERSNIIDFDAEKSLLEVWFGCAFLFGTEQTSSGN